VISLRLGAGIPAHAGKASDAAAIAASASRAEARMPLPSSSSCSAGLRTSISRPSRFEIHSPRIKLRTSVMDQCLQVAEIVDQKIGWGILERFRGVPIGHAASPDTCVSAGTDIDRGITDDPGTFPLTLRVR